MITMLARNSRRGRCKGPRSGKMVRRPAIAWQEFSAPSSRSDRGWSSEQFPARNCRNLRAIEPIVMVTSSCDGVGHFEDHVRTPVGQAGYLADRIRSLNLISPDVEDLFFGP